MSFELGLEETHTRKKRNISFETKIKIETTNRGNSYFSPLHKDPESDSNPIDAESKCKFSLKNQKARV